MFIPGFIIVGLLYFREGGLFGPPHQWAAPKRPILNREAAIYFGKDKQANQKKIVEYFESKNRM